MSAKDAVRQFGQSLGLASVRVGDRVHLGGGRFLVVDRAAADGDPEDWTLLIDQNDARWHLAEEAA